MERGFKIPGLSCQSCSILPHCYGPLRAVDGSCAPQYKPSALLTVRILSTYEAYISLLHQSTVYARFAICTIRTDQKTVHTLSCREIFYVPPMRCNLRIVNSSLRTVREFCNPKMAYTHRYSASILDNPGFRYTKKHPKNENAKISIRPRNNKACAV